MASIRKEFSIAAGAESVWRALRAVGEVHRFAPGFVTDCRMDGDEARIITFANGFVTRELIVDVDDKARRLAYSARSERLQHHHATFQVVDDGPARSTVLWTADVLPHAAAATVGTMMEQGAAAMSKTLGGHSQAA
jgi:carbon monoxide dehydrogenase subunit G